MKKASVYLEEDEEEYGDEKEWSAEIKRSVVEFVLRKFGILSSSDLSKALSWKVREVNQVLKYLESTGRVKHAKLGRNSVWSPAEERYLSPMYY